MTKRRRANSSRPGIASPARFNRKLGLTTTEIMSAVGPGGVRALHIMGENPMMSEPNLNHTRHMIEQLEFLVAQDLFINESGAYADVFLPAASWAEKEGTFTNTDRRVQRVRKALEPRGQSRADWQIICDLAERIEKKLRPRRRQPFGHTNARPKYSTRWVASFLNTPA